MNYSKDDDGDEERSAGSVEIHDKLVEEAAWNFQGFQGADCLSASELEAIRNLFSKYNVSERDSLAGCQSIIEDKIASIPRVVDSSDRLSKAKNDCASHTWQYGERVTRQVQRALQYKTIEQ